MKSLGMVRKIDELGRIVLPIEIRKMMDLSPGNGVEIFSDKDRIILQKYAPSCIFCGEADNIVIYKDKRVCKACLEEMKGI
ncbi:MAG: AbrB/MazE/SpoVT family DNA-binding domain-containing protein [Clostridia bacterium]|nr:AbrB/MazE/SpoVT family DNA-binding domain-containing protein [Clostridia bacterium]